MNYIPDPNHIDFFPAEIKKGKTIQNEALKQG